jgi:ribosomal protein L7Ae-like RNA K-turn-binding protein
VTIKNVEPVELRCYLSGKILTNTEVVFLTVSPDGVLIIDLTKELPGKHMYLECKRNVVDLAIERGILEKFFGENVNIPTDFAERIFVLLRKKALELICIAKKSGILTFGFEKVSAALRAGDAECILYASDCKGSRKKKTALNAGAIRIISIFTCLELGKVVGRNRVVYVAILKGNVNMIKILMSVITRVQNF